MKKTGRLFFLWTLGLCLSLSFMADADDLNKISGQAPLKKASIQDSASLRATYPAVTYFDYGDPTNEEQLHLELINRARMNPFEEAARLGIDLFEGTAAGDISGDPVQPLTFNAMLLDAARAHSQDMLRENYFNHSSLTGDSPFDRMKTAGYDYSTAGENIAWTGSTSPVMDMAQASMQLHSNLFIDKNYPGRGHRINIFNPQYREIGAGLAYGPYTSGSSTYTHTFMVTCDFGASRLQPCPYILGVVYDDLDKDAFYDAGEGLEGVFIELLESADSTETMSAGGYALPVEPGTYTVAARLTQGGSVEKKVTITDQNVKIDFLKSEFNITEPAACCSVSPDLGIIVPCAVYTGSREPLYMALELEYAQSKQTGSAMYWSLKNAEILEKTANCGHAEISPDLNITIFCAQLNDLSLSLELKYQGQDSQGDFIWNLHDFTVID